MLVGLWTGIDRSFRKVRANLYTLRCERLLFVVVSLMRSRVCFRDYLRHDLLPGFFLCRARAFKVVRLSFQSFRSCLLQLHCESARSFKSITSLLNCNCIPFCPVGAATSGKRARIGSFSGRAGTAEHVRNPMI